MMAMDFEKGGERRGDDEGVGKVWSEVVKLGYARFKNKN